MKLSDLDAFTFANAEDLKKEAACRGLVLPYSDNLSVLAEAFSAGCARVPNRLCAQPVESCAAESDGSPGPDLARRYAALAAGGFGLIWVEACAVAPEGRSNPNQLMLSSGNVGAWRNFISEIRRASRRSWNRDVVIIIQLSHAGRHSRPDGTPRPVLAQSAHSQSDSHFAVVVSDADLHALEGAYVAAAGLAKEAGADGVDIKCCHDDLAASFLSARRREGEWGGCLENRARFATDVVRAVRKAHPQLMVAVRLGVYDGRPYPFGFGVDRDDPRRPDLQEPLRVVRMLCDAGISLLSVTVSGVAHIENPLDRIAFEIEVVRRVQKAFPAVPVVAGGLSWLRGFALNVGAGMVSEGCAACAGFGRAALANPEMAAGVLKGAAVGSGAVCFACRGCEILNAGGARTGCVVTGEAAYGRSARELYRMLPERLLEEARRCHQCLDAPCMAGCPAGVDIPGFIRAYRDGDIGLAYSALRKSLVLPEMCSQLCPVWMLCEGRCIEGILTGRPVAIRDIQYAVSIAARQGGHASRSAPKFRKTGRVGIVGAGPTGLSAAVCLAGKGYGVVVFERSSRAGGTPELVIPTERYRSCSEEINAVTGAFVRTGLLRFEFCSSLGRDMDLAGLASQFDAVLIATGVWEETSKAERQNGVTDALSFLLRAKEDEGFRCGGTVAVVAGGDCAMDVATEALRRGAARVYVIYEGELASLHWHGPEGWFRTPGVQLLTLVKTLEYVPGVGGRIGVRLQPLFSAECQAGTFRGDSPTAANELIIWVDLIVEAAGLVVERAVREGCRGVNFGNTGTLLTRNAESFSTDLPKVFAAGAVVNGGASVAQCVFEGMRAAEEIDAFLGRSG